MKKIVLILTLCLSGCVRHARPQLTVRHCAVGSCESEAMYKGQVVHVCFVIDPECAVGKAGKDWKCTQVDGCPVRDIVAKGMPNDYLDIDDDEGVKDKETKKHVWWKFWEKNAKDTD
jgi:hypothetical protein